MDLNVPIRNGIILDETRLKSIVPTVNQLIEKGAKQIILLSHLGRPNGIDENYSLKFLLPNLISLLGQDVSFGEDFRAKIHLCENVRFDAGEEKNSLEYAKRLASLGDVFINDAFSVSHRAHASVEGITHFLPSYAGLEMEKEIYYLEKVLIAPSCPSVALVGGAKVSTKIDILKNLIKNIDVLILGGGMANTFLSAQGFDVQNSLVERDLENLAREIINLCKEKEVQLILPQDCAIQKNGIRIEKNLLSLEEGDAIIDVSDATLAEIHSVLTKAKTVLWNGPFGCFEETWGAKGTLEIAKMIADLGQDVLSLAGGGETVAAINTLNLASKFGYVSNAGGAFLEWLSGAELPGVKVLEENL